jgi:hypothetical protein
MSKPLATHAHYCNCCWNLYECLCTAPFVPESYRCETCSEIQDDADFMHAIGIRWTGPAEFTDYVGDNTEPSHLLEAKNSSDL